MLLLLPLIHSLDRLAPCYSLAPIVCLLVLSSFFQILLETPGDHHIVETKEWVSHLVEYEPEGSKGKETTGDHY